MILIYQLNATMNHCECCLQHWLTAVWQKMDDETASCAMWEKSNVVLWGHSILSCDGEILHQKLCS
jgi:hypothetical protein